MSILQQLNNEMADVVYTVRQSLVRISDGRGNGAGTIWHKDGLIITNAHVIGSDANLQVSLPDGATLPAQVIAYDPALDLAALSVEARDLPTIELGKSSQLQAGQWVNAIGHPWGVHGAVTGGIVIGMGIQFPELPLGQREWVMANLHLRPGHSGGPMVNILGELVGINTIMTGPDIGGAVPVDVVKQFLKDRVN